MDRPKSLIMDLTHFTDDLPDDDVRGLVARHGVSFEVHPEAVSFSGGRRGDGWTIDLFATRSEADGELHGGEVTHHLDDVLRAIARAVIPRFDGNAHPDNVIVELGHYTGAVIVDPRKEFQEQVRLRMSIHDAVEDGDAANERAAMEDIRSKLLELGCRG